MITSLILNASIGGGEILLLLLIALIIILLFFRKRGKDTLKQVALATSIKNTGFSSAATILIIRNIIMKALKKDGFHVIDLSVVHEFEGRYQGMIQTKESGQSVLKIVADHFGNVQWTEV